jgi:hypothetical protein
MKLSDMAFVSSPLKQLWWEVTPLTLAFVLTPIVPTIKIPCRRNFCTMPGPKICAWVWLRMRIPSAIGIPEVGLQKAGELGGSGTLSGSAGPVMVKPFNRNLI